MNALASTLKVLTAALPLFFSTLLKTNKINFLTVQSSMKDYTIQELLIKIQGFSLALTLKCSKT